MENIRDILKREVEKAATSEDVPRQMAARAVEESGIAVIDISSSSAEVRIQADDTELVMGPYEMVYINTLASARQQDEQIGAEFAL